MSEKEMNSYRFVSGQEPSDEMLSQLMSEVAEEAVERRKRADEEHFSQMKRNIAAKREMGRTYKSRRKWLRQNIDQN